MTPDMLFALIPITALMIPIAVTAGRTAQRWIGLQETKAQLAMKVADSEAASHSAKIERLEAHVAVLNRIATDRASGLAHEIDALRGPVAPLN